MLELVGTPEDQFYRVAAHIYQTIHVFSLFAVELPEAGPSDTMDSWNPMEEDFYSIRNSYNIDVDDAGVATTGYSKSKTI